MTYLVGTDVCHNRDIGLVEESRKSIEYNFGSLCSIFFDSE